MTQFVGTSFALILGQMIKALRENHPEGSLPQERIATALDVSVMSISRLEKGQAELSVPEMEKLGEFFKIGAENYLKIALKIKTILIEQGCLILQNKHEIKAMPDFKKIDVQLIYALCQKFLQENKQK